MRKVLSPEMVAHVWANKSQDEARNSGETFYFTGPTIYSYGSHFAIAHHLDNGVVLWNNAGYSNTTSRHKSHAWRALSRTQIAAHISVNGLNSDLVRNLEYCRTNAAAAGKMPDLVQSCINSVVSCIESIVGMRSADKMAGALHSAKGYETTGRALCEYVKQGKKAPKWPLPALPDFVPADKAERDSFVRSIAKSSLMEVSNKALAAFKTSHAGITANLNNPDIASYEASSLLGSIKSAHANLQKAARHYTMANPGKTLPRLKAYEKQLGADAETAKQIAHAVRIRETLAGMRSMVKTISKFSRSANDMAKRAQYVSRNIEGLVQAYTEYAPTVPAIAAYAWIVARAQNIDVWHQAERALSRAESQLASARSYKEGSERHIASHGRDMAGYFKDAAAAYKRTIAELRHVAPCTAFMKYKAEQIESMRIEAGDYVRDAVAREQAAQAQVIADWKAGISNVRPSFDAGTFARINGDIVETSRGASVPLEHACRLARIARRLIGHGGKTWSDGTGPQVGHFRVSSIFDDGSAVIGCHEFDADESMRVLALLDACPACVAA